MSVMAVGAMASFERALAANITMTPYGIDRCPSGPTGTRVSGGQAEAAPILPARGRPRAPRRYLLNLLFDIICMGAMAETPETQLIEALKKVDVYGDIAPPHVQDPMTMVLRQNAIQADLIRWDDSRARFVLTGTGRNRITARSRTSGKILRFKMRDEKDGRGPLRKA